LYSLWIETCTTICRRYLSGGEAKAERLDADRTGWRSRGWRIDIAKRRKKKMEIIIIIIILWTDRIGKGLVEDIIAASSRGYIYSTHTHVADSSQAPPVTRTTAVGHPSSCTPDALR